MVSKRSFLASILAGATALLGPGLAARAAPRRPAQADSGLGGTWAGVRTPTSGPVRGYRMLVSFTEAGAVISSELDVDRTAAHGTWQQTGPDQYTFTAVALRLDATHPGAFTGTVKLRQNLTLEGDSWSGPFRVEYFDRDGRLRSSWAGTTRATRVAVEPL